MKLITTNGVSLQAETVEEAAILIGLVVNRQTKAATNPRMVKKVTKVVVRRKRRNKVACPICGKRVKFLSMHQRYSHPELVR